MFLTALTVILFSVLLLLVLENATYYEIIAVRIVFVILGVAFFAPFHAWAQQLIPETSRYTIISFGYALGSQLLGSPTAALSLWCYKKTGLIASLAWYWTALAIASSLAILMTIGEKSIKQKKVVDYEKV